MGKNLSTLFLQKTILVSRADVTLVLETWALGTRLPKEKVKTTHYEICLTAELNSARDQPGRQKVAREQEVLSWLLHEKDVKISENCVLYSGWTTDFILDITE